MCELVRTVLAVQTPLNNSIKENLYDWNLYIRVFAHFFFFFPSFISARAMHLLYLHLLNKKYVDDCHVQVLSLIHI